MVFSFRVYFVLPIHIVSWSSSKASNSVRQLWYQLDVGDVLVGDRIYCSYCEIALLSRRGVAGVLHNHQSRKADFAVRRATRNLANHANSPNNDS